MYPVVLAGGNGTRLWPLSRSAFPKQLLPLMGEQTMLQQTLNRLQGLNCAHPLIICNQAHRFIVAEQLRANDKKARILLEPQGKNTAPAVALAALMAMEQDPEAHILVLAADHLVRDNKGFCDAVRAGLSPDVADKLVTFGVTPEYAETGYGYIKTGESIGPAKRVAQFVEKPDQNTANHYVESGDYYWNSGIFLMKAQRFLNELKRHAPDILSVCQACFDQKYVDLDFIRLPEDLFASCRADSVDYAVMEKTSDAVTVAMDVGWSDLGSWQALWQNTEQDEANNAAIGDVIKVQSEGCYFNAQDKLIAAVGVKDLVVVETKDAVLVADKNRVQEVKDLVDCLKHNDRPEVVFHREVYRPWGMYDSIDNGERYQVKHISVKPGEKLSIQMHHHRAEHWIVVSGTAKVTVGEKTFLVTENESTYIPIGELHALENPGKVPLEMIEVQSGSYLGEDDIVRFEDRYGRSSNE
ncbi:mannose-1-phosphate guanylyltransferase/mannose-6-phosphate isomerase [Paraferrimonas sedimenticola]|uniref:mannose-1-phosphate guanylyltransferase/mannose-6-phosphate isomerase n=1 Tax=Paraferrimonas sedimenticola TaxID=375674 RepID=UPI000BA9AE2D|nr:mannose-1-phosphate guanylyltransferase/mannose-6-phosphate isomerase [Paraferrimonas sedimenticola]